MTDGITWDGDELPHNLDIVKYGLNQVCDDSILNLRAYLKDGGRLCLDGTFVSAGFG